MQPYLAAGHPGIDADVVGITFLERIRSLAACCTTIDDGGLQSSSWRTPAQAGRSLPAVDTSEMSELLLGESGDCILAKERPAASACGAPRIGKRSWIRAWN